MAAARADEGVDDGRALTGVGMSDEEPVFRTELGRANRVFHDVGVESRLTVVKMSGQRLPLGEEIAARFTEARLWQDARGENPLSS